MHLRRRRSLVLAALVGAVLAACGGEESDAPAVTGPTVASDETVEIAMTDFEFEPQTITVRSGTTVRFRFRNTGAFVHDAHFGDEAAQKAVEDGKAPRDGPEVGPKKATEIVRTFPQPGQLIIGCHQPGHYRQGMKARLIVS